VNTGAIVDVEPGEAEWTLDVVESLFDFYFVRPAKLAARKAEINKKTHRGGEATVEVRSGRAPPHAAMTHRYSQVACSSQVFLFCGEDGTRRGSRGTRGQPQFSLWVSARSSGRG
jgi:hypothetical protein